MQKSRTLVWLGVGFFSALLLDDMALADSRRSYGAGRGAIRESHRDVQRRRAELRKDFGELRRERAELRSDIPGEPRVTRLPAEDRKSSVT
jgi:hypothetical protein